MSGRSGRPSLGAPAIADGDYLPRCFLLFAGSQPAPRGGLGDLVGAFTSESAAREAFRRLRVSRTSASSWAQLAIVDGDRGIRAISWFGIGAKPARTPVTLQTTTRRVPSPAGPHVGPTARRHVAGRAVACLVSFVAFAALAIGVLSDDGSPRPVTGGEPAVVAGTSGADG